MDPFIGEIDLCLQLILEILWYVRFLCSTRQFVWFVDPPVVIMLLPYMVLHWALCETSVRRSLLLAEVLTLWCQCQGDLFLGMNDQLFFLVGVQCWSNFASNTILLKDSCCLKFSPFLDYSQLRFSLLRIDQPCHFQFGNFSFGWIIAVRSLNLVCIVRQSKRNILCAVW